MMKSIQSLNTKLSISFESIVFFLTAPLIFIGSFLAEKLLNITYNLKQFYTNYALIFLFIIICILFLIYLFGKKSYNDKNDKILIFLLFILLILSFSILYRYSICDLGYNYTTISFLISKYPYFIVETTDYIQDYEKYSKVKAYIIAFTDYNKFERTKISINFYSDEVSKISAGTLFLYSSNSLKKYSTINYLEEKQRISLSRTDSISIIKNGTKFNKFRLMLRNRIFERLFKYYDRWNLGFAYAVLTGSRQFVFQPLLEVFQNTGTSHLFALSGQHLSILLLIVGLFTSNSIVLIIFSFIYLAFAGWQISFLRAFYSLIFAILIKRFNLKPKFENIIALLTLFVFISEPENINSISFMLSLTAIAALMIYFYIDLNEKNKFYKYLIIPFIGSLNIFIFQLPIVLTYFGRINLITPIINIIAIPLFTIALYFVIISLFFNPFMLFSNIAKGFFNLLSIILTWISKYKIFVIEAKLKPLIGYSLLFLIYLSQFILIQYLKKQKYFTRMKNI